MGITTSSRSGTTSPGLCTQSAMYGAAPAMASATSSPEVSTTRSAVAVAATAASTSPLACARLTCRVTTRSIPNIVMTENMSTMPVASV